MKKNLVIWKYQILLLLRNRQLIIGLFVLLLASLFGAGYGNHFVEQQNNVIYSADTLNQNNIKRSDEMSRKWKMEINPLHHPEVAIYHPSPFASLAIGQKDNYPFYHIIDNFSNIYSVTSTDIQNPVKLLAGNFDLSYVLIYLFPLFIIVFGYNVLSEEKESNTFTLLSIQGNANHVILNKLLFRMFAIILVSLIINLLAFWMNGISWQHQYQNMISWMLITIAYIIFWFALVYFVVSFKKTGAITALILSGFWVLLLLLLPSIIHRNVVSPQEKQQVESIFNSRGDFKRAYTLEPAVIKDSFNKLQHPYSLKQPAADTGKQADTYKNLMMHEIQVRHNNHISKKPVLQQADEYRQTLKWNWINPVFTVQNAYNQVAGTEINNFHQYLDTVEKYQLKKRYLIHNIRIAGEDYKATDIDIPPKFKYNPQPVAVPLALGFIFPVLVITLLLILMGSLNLNNKK